MLNPVSWGWLASDGGSGLGFGPEFFFFFSKKEVLLLLGVGGVRLGSFENDLIWGLAAMKVFPSVCLPHCLARFLQF